MKECKKCQGEIQKYLWIEGTKKNLQNRKFCLTCSPWGQHNTRDLSDLNKVHKYHVKCAECNREFNAPQKRRAQCISCYFNAKKKKRINEVKEIVGCKCWFCEYDRTWNNLAFHHVNPDEKVMNLTSRELTGYSWKKVLTELKKCVLCCHNCHGEIHAGLIEDTEVQKHYNFWDNQFDKSTN